MWVVTKNEVVCCVELVMSGRKGNAAREEPRYEHALEIYKKEPSRKTAFSVTSRGAIARSLMNEIKGLLQGT